MNYIHEYALILSIILTSVSQIILKMGSETNKKWIYSLLSYKIFLGYFLLFIVTILNVLVMQKIQLKTMTAWISLTYIIVNILSYFFFKENINKDKILGSVIIVSGIIIYSL